jgi:hypothetical protein
VELEALEALEGTAFPGGSFRIPPHEDHLLRQVLLADRGDGTTAHPLWGFAAPQRSMGVTLAEVFALCGSSAAEGPLLGETTVELVTPLLLEQEYQVRGGITRAVRKRGRTAGTFDVVTFTVTTRLAASGALAGNLTNAFVFPRPS